MSYVVKQGQNSNAPIKEEPFFASLLQEEALAAFLRGKEEGEKIGYAKAKEEERALLQILQTITEKFLEQKNHLFTQLKPEIIDLSIACAEKITRIELSQREKMIKLIENLLAICSPSMENQEVKIFISPEDFVMIEEMMKEVKGVQFQSDSFMKRGDCRIEAKNCLLNFLITRELEDLRAKILRF